MDTNIALADLASGRTVLVGAECRRGVHDAPPGCAWKTLPREVCLDPRWLYNCTVPRFGVELPNTAWLLKTGLIGSIIAALCCLTPILAVLLGAVGLGWFVGYLDYVLVPVMIIFLGLVGYVVWRNAKKAR